MRVRRHVGAVRLDAEEVGGGELLHVPVLLRVEVELHGPALALRLLVGEEGRGVVAAHLHVAHAVRRGAVPVVEDHGADGLESALVVGAHGHDHDHERVFLRGGDADLRAGADEERAQVERTAGAVGRHVLDVRGHDLLGRLVDSPGFAR